MNFEIDISKRLRRRRIWRGAIAVSLTIIAMAALADQLGAFGYRGDDWDRFDRAGGVVESSVDAVTLRVNFDGRVEAVRLVGVQAPTDPAHQENARKYLTARTQQKKVWLKLEPLEPRDREGVLLAYVYLTDDDTLNADIVRDGLCGADRQRDHSMRSLFELNESLARKAKRGMWRDR